MLTLKIMDNMRNCGSRIETRRKCNAGIHQRNLSADRQNVYGRPRPRRGWHWERKPLDIGIYIAFEPSPIKDNAVFQEDIPDYEVSVRAFDKTAQMELFTKEVAALPQSENTATRKIAGAVIGLSKESRHVTKEECWEAFDALAQKEIQGLRAVCAELEEWRKESAARFSAEAVFLFVFYKK